MIHPINIPEDLMSSNPKQEQFVAQRPRRPTLTYTPDGRRMLNGQPTTPSEPTKLWNDFFLRSITRCLVADSESAAPGQDQGTLLDVVDLSPSSPQQSFDDDGVPDSPPPFKHLVSSIASTSPNSRHFGHKVLSRTASVQSSGSDKSELGPQASDEGGNDERAFREMQADMKRRGKQPVSKQDSLIVDLKSVSSNLSPCCSGDQLEHEKLKEFVRFDFERINLFASDRNSRRKSVILIPSSIGRRIWVNKTCLDRCTAVELSPSAVLAQTKGSNEKPELRFHVSSVATHNNQLLIDVYVYNTYPKELHFQTYLHAHSVNGRIIGPKIISTEHEFAIQPVEDNNVKIAMDLSDDLRDACQPENSYLIVTLMGRILH
ncbi:hypothetical protein L596_008977 [Steinernema carpocapsae]|uniref:Uncharacterized protein n=1 Tax=Steinernema carpocapsae TaxID=34508 RepID=A0A4U5PE29_STECR|nr:hypothetical protein L596_008977 [Steinernema carpocapsae]